LHAKQRADEDLKNTLEKKKALGDRVDGALNEFQVAAGSEGATMESLEKEMMDKMTL